MSGPTTRVLTVLELLQAHGQIGGAELAERLGVDRRTIRRYITVLEELGIPIMTEQGRYGGYRLVAGFKLPPMMFTEEETLAVSLGLLAAWTLERAMPANLKKRVRGVSDTTRVILPRGEPSLDDRSLQTLTVAAEAMRRVGLTYHSEDHGGINRSVDPYGLVFRQGRWYLTGFCHLRQAAFQRPPDFDAADFLTESLRSWGGTHEVSLLLHTDRESAAAVLSFHASCAEGLEQRDDGILLNTQTDSFEWFAWWLAHLPFRFTILKPDGLKDAVREHAAQLLASCD